MINLYCLFIFRSNSMGNSVAYGGLLLIELILLALKFIYTTVESIIRTFLPPLEKSLKDEVILVSCLINSIILLSIGALVLYVRYA